MYAPDVTARCPTCTAPMYLVLSGRYHTCPTCPIAHRPFVYVPIDDAPLHPLHGVPSTCAMPVPTTKPPKPKKPAPAVQRPAHRQQQLQGARA